MKTFPISSSFDKSFNTPFFMTVMLFISAVGAMFSQQLQKDIANKQVLLDDQVLELKKEIAGGGTIDLIDGTTERIDGVCSFDKNRLSTGRAFIFNEVAISYAANADSGKEGALAYSTKAPAELQNALFIISQEGREVLRMPLRELTNTYTPNSEAEDYAELKTLRYLADDRTITMQIKFPPGVALATGANKHYVYVRLKGVQTSKKPA